jgi:hypothetical protein
MACAEVGNPVYTFYQRMNPDEDWVEWFVSGQNGDYENI